MAKWWADPIVHPPEAEVHVGDRLAFDGWKLIVSDPRGMHETELLPISEQVARALIASGLALEG